MDIFSQSGINNMAYALNTAAAKNKLIAENMANVDTPGYKAKKLEYKEVMKEYFSNSSEKKLPMAVTTEGHIPSSSSNPADPATFGRLQNNPSLRNDGNDVNSDYEMSELSANSIMYSMISQLAAGKFTSIKSAITGR